MSKSVKKHASRLLIAPALLALAASARADITGFSSFAPVNNPGSVAGIGYSLDGSTYNLTTPAASEASSGWNPVAQNITAFTETFSYTSVPGYNSSGSTLAADGLSIDFQSPTGSTAAVGGTGGARGYGGIAGSSAAVQFDNFGSYYNYGGAVATATNGGSAGTFTGFSNGINLSYGRTENVTVKYANSNLVVTLTDPSTHASFVKAYTGVNLPSIIGSNTALVGLSGGTGGYNASQSVTNFSFKSNAASLLNTFVPIGISSGFNQGVVVPASAAVTTPTAPFTTVTATLDGGTSKSGYTFYEAGYNTAALTTGLPASGSTFVSASDPTHSFKMQTYGAGADALLLSAANLSGTFNLSTPAAYSGLSFLVSDGGGDGEFSATLNFANGTSETDDGLVSPDWFQPGLVAWDASGRVNSTNGYNAVGTTNPSLFQVDLSPTDTTDAIKSITLTYDNYSSDNSNVAIFAVSGSPVPEPASLSLLGLGAFGLLGRRRRASR